MQQAIKSEQQARQVQLHAKAASLRVHAEQRREHGQRIVTRAGERLPGVLRRPLLAALCKVNRDKPAATRAQLTAGLALRY
jgi:hypothetical protein